MTTLVNYLAAGLVGGAAAFAHCLGMCGPFALHLAGPQATGRPFVRQVFWHTGRIFTYLFLGALAGFLGAAVVRTPALATFQKALGWSLGGVMALMGLGMMGLHWRPAGGKTPSWVSLLPAAWADVLASPGGGAAFVLGLIGGFLPCPIVLGFLAWSAASGSVVAGMATMAGVGVGTIWSLALVAVTGQVIRPRLRRWGMFAGGIILILLGAATALRGTDAVHGVLGCPDCQAAAAHESAGRQAGPAAVPTTRPCCCEKDSPRLENSAE